MKSNTVSRPALVLLGTVALAACGAPSQPYTSTSGYSGSPAYNQILSRMDAENAQRRSEFESRRIEWTVPANARTLAEAKIRDILRDPESARFRHDFTTVKGDSIAVCGAVNARNAMGGYAGFQRFYAEIVRGRVVDANILNNNATEHRIVQNCGYNSDSDNIRSAIEAQRPAESQPTSEPRSARRR